VQTLSIFLPDPVLGEPLRSSGATALGRGRGGRGEPQATVREAVGESMGLLGRGDGENDCMAAHLEDILPPEPLSNAE